MPLLKTSASERKDRVLEEAMYEQAADELSRGEVRNGLWVKALTESNGNESLAAGVYIKYRVQSLKDEYQDKKYIENQKKVDAVKKAVKDEFKGEPGRKATAEETLMAILGFAMMGGIVWWLLSLLF